MNKKRRIFIKGLHVIKVVLFGAIMLAIGFVIGTVHTNDKLYDNTSLNTLDFTDKSNDSIPILNNGDIILSKYVNVIHRERKVQNNDVVYFDSVYRLEPIKAIEHFLKTFYSSADSSVYVKSLLIGFEENDTTIHVISNLFFNDSTVNKNLTMKLYFAPGTNEFDMIINDLMETNIEYNIHFNS